MAQQNALHQYGSSSIAGRATVQQGDRHITNHIFIATAHLSLSDELNVSNSDASCSIARYGDAHLLSRKKMSANSLHSFPPATDVGSLLALALQVSEKLSFVCHLSRKLKVRLRQTQFRLSVLRMRLEKLTDTVTSHISTKQGLSFQILLEHVIDDCAELFMRIGRTLEKIIGPSSTRTKVYARMLVRIRSWAADGELDLYDQELEKRCSILHMCMEDQNKHFAAPITLNAVEIQRTRPMIEDVLLNVSWRRGSRSPVQGNLYVSLKRIGYARRDFEEFAFFLHAENLLKCMRRLTRWLIRGTDFDIHDGEFYSSRGCLQPRWLDFLTRSPQPRRRVQRLSAQHPTQADKVTKQVFYCSFNILIDTREEIDPFSKLLDALICQLTAHDHYWDFWSAVRRYVTNGETTLSLEQKVQLMVHLLSYLDGWSTVVTIRAGFMHEGPCFATGWKANLHGFSALLRGIPFRFLYFTYNCIRVDFTTDPSFVRVLDKQQCSFAFNAGSGPGLLELFEFDCQLVSTDGKIRGTGACAEPDESNATVDWQLIDSPRIQCDEVGWAIEKSGVTAGPQPRYLVEFRVWCSKRNIRPKQAPINSRSLGGCPVPIKAIYHRYPRADHETIPQSS